MLQALRRCPWFVESVTRAAEAHGDAAGVVPDLARLFATMEAKESAARTATAAAAADSEELAAGPARPVHKRITATPTELLAAVQAANPLFQAGRQQDAQELLHFLLDTTSIGPPKRPAKRRREDGPANSASDGSAAVPATELSTPLAKEIFAGSLAYSTQCCECEETSCRSEEFIDLTLPASKDLGRSVTWGLSQLFDRRERLKGCNKYLCANCNTYTEATRTVRVGTLPGVLILHLNRTSGGAAKVKAHMQSPFLISLDRWCSGTITPSRYELCAVVFHAGQSASAGHYTCVAVDSCGETKTAAAAEARPASIAGCHSGVGCPRSWLVFDDTDVKRVSPDAVQQMMAPLCKSGSTAYMLFYRRLL